MSVRWDPVLVRHVAAELDELLAGGRVRGLRLDGTTRDVVLILRERTLLWRLHPERGHILLYPPREPSADTLRVAGSVRGVRASDDERILHLRIVPARGKRPDLVVHVELLGNQWNLVVCEDPGDRIRHVLVSRTGSRPLRVGETYAAPRPLVREGRSESLGLGRWMEILEPLAPEARARALVGSIAYTSPLNAPALLGKAALVSGPEARAALEEGWAAWKRMAEAAAPPDPAVLESEHGPQPYPFPLPGMPSRHADSLLDAFALSAERTEEARGASPLALLPGGLLAELDAAVDAALRRVTRIEAELAALEDPDELRTLGNVLLAHYADVPRGASQVTLPGFSGETVVVPLDPGLEPHENASKLYARAGRVERARERLPDLLARARARAARLEEVLERARLGQASEAEIRALAPAREQGEQGRRGRRTVLAALPYRSYRSSGGLEIRVGKGARQNDDLTFHHAAPGDVWLHARHAAGAHVVLRWSGPGSPPGRDLTEAAVLAALRSEARTSASVPVDWTFRKYVRKPRGAAPGQVVMERAHTVFVAPDPALAERLATDAGEEG